MSVRKIQKVAVIGSGSMGHQIAMLAALGGFQTYLQDINEDALDEAVDKLEGQMNKWL